MLERSSTQKEVWEAVMAKISQRMEEVIKKACGRIERKLREWQGEIKREWEELKKQWKEEREEIGARMNDLEKRIKGMEVEKKVREENEGEEKEERGEEKKEGTKMRIREIEIIWERKEREERRWNLIIKGVKMAEDKCWEEEIENIWGKIGVVGERKG